jgi:hypothetical protein
MSHYNHPFALALPPHIPCLGSHTASIRCNAMKLLIDSLYLYHRLLVTRRVPHSSTRIYSRAFFASRCICIITHQPGSWMKEVRDNTSRKGGLPTLPSLYLSTFQPSQRVFLRVHVCKGRESWRKHI